MLPFKLKIIAAVMLVATGCVQKAYKKTVSVVLTLPEKRPIAAVGIRGSDSPLNWDTDYPMQAIIKDSVYAGSFQVMTGFMFTEIKFVADGQMELQGKPNRIIRFEQNKDSVFVNAIYDRE